MNKRPNNSLDIALVDSNKKRKSSNGLVLVEDKQISIIRHKHSLKASALQLMGHEGEVLSCMFHPSGNLFASSGVDRCIFLWKSSGNCKNTCVYNAAHSNAILDINFTQSSNQMISCSADKTAVVWDLETGCRSKKLKSHESFVNAVDVSKRTSDLVSSVGDDGIISVWDLRQRKASFRLKDIYPLLSVSFNKLDNLVFVGGIENTINAWDLRNSQKSYCLIGHSDTVTGLSLSHDGNRLLSNSMDNTLKSWDVRAFSHLNRLEKTFSGHHHNFEKALLRCSWSPDGNLISAGSSDKNVSIWNYYSQELVYSKASHRGSVNQVVFSPIEPLFLSCSSDRSLIISEIDSNLII